MSYLNMGEEMRRAEYINTKLPAVGLETDIAEIIERHLDVYAGVDEWGEPYSDVSGIESAALAVVAELRSRGLIVGETP